MTLVLEQDRLGRSVLTVRCDGCPRSATTDLGRPEAFCALIGWRRQGETDFCTLCQWLRGITPTFAKRLADRL